MVAVLMEKTRQPPHMSPEVLRPGDPSDLSAGGAAHDPSTLSEVVPVVRGRRSGGQTFICGGDEAPGPRGTDCPNRLHDHPLPSGYVDAAVVAGRRLSKRWANPKCPDCGLYGWAPGVTS